MYMYVYIYIYEVMYRPGATTRRRAGRRRSTFCIQLSRIVSVDSEGFGGEPPAIESSYQLSYPPKRHPKTKRCLARGHMLSVGGAK